MTGKVFAMLLAGVLSFSNPAKASIFGWGKNPDVTYIVVSNNLGFVDDEESRQLTEKAAFTALKREMDEAKSGDARGRQVRLIFTTHANNIAFSGTGLELAKEGARLSELIGNFQARCNDLSRSYDAVERDIMLNKFEKVRIVHIGRFIHAPAPCANNGPIVIPQDMPKKFALADILKEADYAEFTVYNIHQDQHEPLVRYLSESKITGKAKYVIEIFREDETRTKVGFTGVAAKQTNGGGKP